MLEAVRHQKKAPKIWVAIEEARKGPREVLKPQWNCRLEVRLRCLQTCIRETRIHRCSQACDQEAPGSYPVLQQWLITLLGPQCMNYWACLWPVCSLEHAGPLASAMWTPVRSWFTLVPHLGHAFTRCEESKWLVWRALLRCRCMDKTCSSPLISFFAGWQNCSMRMTNALGYNWGLTRVTLCTFSKRKK